MQQYLKPCVTLLGNQHLLPSFSENADTHANFTHSFLPAKELSFKQVTTFKQA